MGGLVRGEVVVMPFPFSDLSMSKRRPALVIAPLSGVDVILCMITSKAVQDESAVGVTADDFTSGGLPLNSFVRPSRLFTADGRLIERSAGKLTDEKFDEIVQALVQLLKPPAEANGSVPSTDDADPLVHQSP